MSYFQHEVPAAEAAALLGISRRSLYRWIDEGRLSYPLTMESIEARMPEKRQRGPKRNPRSLRYTRGRHRFHQDKPCKHE